MDTANVFASVDTSDPTMGDPTEPSFHQLQKLNHMHMTMVQLVLDGWSAKEIADSTGRSYIGVQHILATPLFQAEVARRRKELNQLADDHSQQVRTKANKILEDSLIECSNKQVELTNSLDERVRQSAISEVFDLMGWKDKKKDEVTQASAQIKVTIGAGALLNLQIALNESNPEDTKNKASGLELVEQQV